MATTLYCTDTLSDLTISGQVVRRLSTSRGSGVVTKTWSTTGASPTQIFDTGTTGLVFAWRVSGTYTPNASNLPLFNVWGSESNAMANYGPDGELDAYQPNGTLRAHLWGPQTGTEWGTSAAVRNTSWDSGDPFTSNTLQDGDYLVFVPGHAAAGGTPASGHTVNWSYGATSGDVNGDTFITMVENLTEFVGVPRVPRSTPYPQILPQ